MLPKGMKRITRKAPVKKSLSKSLPKPKKKSKAGYIGLSAPRKRKKINLV